MGEFRVVQGSCHPLYVFEVGFSIDLADAERRLAHTTERQAFRRPGLAGDPLAARPAPLRVQLDTSATRIGPFAVLPVVEVVLYEFGAVSVGYEIPLGTTADELISLSVRLREDAALLEDARGRVTELIASLGPAVERPRVADLVEDYFVFRVRELAGDADAAAIATRHAELIARLLRAETGALSPEEIADATSARLSFSPRDVTFVDWDSAFLYDPDPDKLRAVLEFANVQLLELRYLDTQLDRIMERSYELLLKRTGFRAVTPSFLAADMRELAFLQVDSAVLLERVSNAIKFLGEEYLARLYRLVSGRLHLAEWDASITRKLATIGSIHEKMADRAAARRMELLEWVIILLITFEVVLSLTR
jgi:hypothetical protein